MIKVSKFKNFLKISKQGDADFVCQNTLRWNLELKPNNYVPDFKHLQLLLIFALKLGQS